MHRSGTRFKLGLRARAEERYEREEEKEEDEIDKYPQLGCNAEQAVHLIPFILLACLLVLYIFSYTPVEGSIPGSVPEKNSVKEVMAASIPVGKKEEALQTFSVYSHRSLQQVQKHQQKKNKVIPKQQKEASRRLMKGNRHEIRRARPKKNSFHRKTRIIHNN